MFVKKECAIQLKSREDTLYGKIFQASVAVETPSRAFELQPAIYKLGQQMDRNNFF